MKFLWIALAAITLFTAPVFASVGSKRLFADHVDDLLTVENRAHNEAARRPRRRQPIAIENGTELHLAEFDSYYEGYQEMSESRFGGKTVTVYDPCFNLSYMNDGGYFNRKIRFSFKKEMRKDTDYGVWVERRGEFRQGTLVELRGAAGGRPIQGVIRALFSNRTALFMTEASRPFDGRHYSLQRLGDLRIVASNRP